MWNSSQDLARVSWRNVQNPSVAGVYAKCFYGYPLLCIGDFFFFFDGYYILEHVHSGPILTIFHSHISRFIEQLASIITPFSFRKNLWFIQCIVVVRHASAQWFQNGTNPPKISSLDVISQTVHITSVSAHCMHFKFKICQIVKVR